MSTTILNNIKYAIDHNLEISIIYEKESGEKSTRILKDIQYSSEYGDTYISAYCYERREERTFKIDRIKDVKITVFYHFNPNKKIFKLYNRDYNE